MFSLQSQIGAPRAPKEFNVTFWWLVVITVVAGVFWIEGRDIANDLRGAAGTPLRLRRDSVAVGAGNGSGHSRVVSAVGIE